MKDLLVYSNRVSNRDGLVFCKISVLEKKIKYRSEISVETVLKGSDKLTRFYTELPTYVVFLKLVEYLEPKALQLRAWRSSETSTSSNMDGLCQKRKYLSMPY